MNPGNTGPLVTFGEVAFIKGYKHELPHVIMEILVKVHAAVEDAEKNTSAHIRVGIHDPNSAKHFQEALVEKRTAEEGDTMHGPNWALVFISLHERKFEIVGSIAMEKILGSEHWTERTKALAQYFVDGNYTKGLCKAVKDLGEELAGRFPKSAQ